MISPAVSVVAVVARHERHVLDAQLRELQLVEQMKGAGRVHHLDRKRVFVPAHAAHFTTLSCSGDDDLRPRSAAAAARPGGGEAPRAAAVNGRAGIEDLLTERRHRCPAGRGEIRADDAAATVDLMAARTPALPKNNVSPAAGFPPAVAAMFAAAGSTPAALARLRTYDTNCQTCSSLSPRNGGIWEPWTPSRIVRNRSPSALPRAEVPVVERRTAIALCRRARGTIGRSGRRAAVRPRSRRDCFRAGCASCRTAERRVPRRRPQGPERRVPRCSANAEQVAEFA